MAFAYQTDDPNEQQKANIFGGGAAGQNAQQPMTESGTEKTTLDGGSLASGQGASQTASAQPSQPKAQPGYDPKTAQKTYAGIAKRLTMPQRLQSAEEALSQGQAKLQEEANAYGLRAQNARNAYKLDDATLQNALKGDQEAFQKTSQRLTQAAPEFESFKGLGENMPNVADIQNSYNIYQNLAGPNYTSGQRRLDAALLRMSPQYRQQQEKILGEAAALGKKNDEMMQSQTEAQRKALSEGYSAETADIRRRLGLMGEDATSRAKAMELEEDARRQALKENEIAQAEYAKLRAEIEKDIKERGDPASAQYRGLQYLQSLSPDDLAKYVSVDRDTDWTEFLKEDEANQFNAAQGLLGGGKILAAGKGAGDPYAFDRGGAYIDVLDRITGKRQAQDRLSQDRIDAIQREAEARAGGYNLADSQSDPYANARNQLLEYARQNAAARYGNDQSMIDRAVLHAQDLFDDPGRRQQLDAAGLIRDNLGSASWTDVLTADEAAELSRLSEDIGVSNRYGAGGYKQEYDLRDLQRYYDEYAKPYMDEYWAAQNARATQPRSEPTGISIVPQPGEPGYVSPNPKPAQTKTAGQGSGGSTSRKYRL